MVAKVEVTIKDGVIEMKISAPEEVIEELLEEIEEAEKRGEIEIDKIELTE